MLTNVEKLEKHRVVLEIEVEPPVFEQAVQKVYHKLARQLVVPGFRRGKVPRRLLENYLGRGALYNEALEVVLPEAYTEAVRQAQIEPATPPELELVCFEEGKPLVFKATVAVKPEVRLGPYKEIEIEKEEVEISEKEVETYLEFQRERHAKLVTVTEGVVEKGDVVTIDCEEEIEKEEGLLDRKKESGVLEIGEKTLFPAFEEELLGLSVGAEKEFVIHYPPDYIDEEVAGREVRYKVKIKELKKRELAPLDDEFAKDVSEFETLAELKEDIRNKLETIAAARGETLFKRRVKEKVVEGAEVEVPEAMVNERLEIYLASLKKDLEQRKLSWEQFLEARQQTETEYNEEARREIETEIREELVLEEIAKKEQITVTEEEIKAEAARLTGQEQKEEPGEGTKKFLENRVLRRKVEDFLVAQAKVKRKEEISVEK